MLLPPTQWMERVIRINSVTHQSNEELVRFLVPLVQECGLQTVEQEVIENGTSFKNLIAFSHSPDADDLLVLNTHLDTVTAGENSDWTKTAGNPFHATRVRDRVYGLGTADVKLDFLCKLWGAKHARPWGRPFVLVGTYGEERGLVGAAELLRQKKIKARYALVGEPSNLELIYAHKGHMLFTFGVPLTAGKVELEKKWKGRSAHSSTPQLGENAIRKGLNDIFKRGMGLLWLEGGSGTNKVPDGCQARLQERTNAGTQKLFDLLRSLDEFASEIRKRRDTRFSPSVNTLSLNLARMAGGELQLTFDIRVLPDTSTDGLQRKLQSIAKSHQLKLNELSTDPPLRGQKNGPFMQAAARALKACGVPVVKKTKASSTEAAVYNAHGAEAIVFGPGISVGNVHRPNEYNSIRQMEVATRFYQTMLKTPIEGS